MKISLNCSVIDDKLARVLEYAPLVSMSAARGNLCKQRGGGGNVEGGGGSPTLVNIQYTVVLAERIISKCLILSMSDKRCISNCLSFVGRAFFTVAKHNRKSKHACTAGDLLASFRGLWICITVSAMSSVVERPPHLPRKCLWI